MKRRAKGPSPAELDNVRQAMEAVARLTPAERAEYDRITKVQGLEPLKRRCHHFFPSGSRICRHCGLSVRELLRVRLRREGL